MTCPTASERRRAYQRETGVLRNPALALLRGAHCSKASVAPGDGVGDRHPSLHGEVDVPTSPFARSLGGGSKRGGPERPPRCGEVDDWSSGAVALVHAGLEAARAERGRREVVEVERRRTMERLHERGRVLPAALLDRLRHPRSRIDGWRRGRRAISARRQGRARSSAHRLLHERGDLLPLRRRSTPSARRRSATWRLRRGSPRR